jgi:hypothetical protein
VGISKPPQGTWVRVLIWYVVVGRRNGSCFPPFPQWSKWNDRNWVSRDEYTISMGCEGIVGLGMRGCDKLMASVHHVQTAERKFGLVYIEGE